MLSVGGAPVFSQYKSKSSDERKVSDLFTPILTGKIQECDKELWNQMESSLGDTFMPSTKKGLLVVLEQTYRDIVGTGVEDNFPGYLKFNGEDSSGFISPAWWRETAFPNLLKRAFPSSSLCQLF